MNKENEGKVSEKDIVFEGKIWTDENGVKHRYVDPMSDPGFKILFGSEGNEELLIALLNSILPGADIVELRYKNTEHQGMLVEDGKAIFDVYCEDENGVKYLVEIQNWSQHYFNKRAVYYSTYAIQDQAAKEKKHQLQTLQKDKWDYNYAPVFVVCFLNFNMRKKIKGLYKVKENEYLSLYRYKEIETGEELGDGTTLVFVEMKKFRKSLEECSTLREMILCTMKSMGTQLENPEEITLDPLLTKFYHLAELAALPAEVRINYISAVMDRNDILNSMAEQIEDARQEGREEGRAEGREEGRAEGREEGERNLARELLKSGVSAERLAEAMKLSVEEVERLLQ